MQHQRLPGFGQMVACNYGGFYPVGVTTVTFTASDACGNTTSESMTITINSCPENDPQHKQLDKKEMMMELNCKYQKLNFRPFRIHLWIK